MTISQSDCQDLKRNQKIPNWFNRLLRRVWREVVQDCEHEDLDRYRPYRVEQDNAVEVTQYHRPDRERLPRVLSN